MKFSQWLSELPSRNSLSFIVIEVKKHEEFFQDNVNPTNCARIRTSNFDRLQVAE